MADGAPPDVGLGHLRHVDGGLHPGGLAEAFERVLEREGVDDGRQHAHVVGLGTIHAGAGTGHPPPDVAAADDHRHVDALVGADTGDLVGDVVGELSVDAVADLAGEGLPRHLQQHPLVPGILGCGGHVPILSRSQPPMNNWA